MRLQPALIFALCAGALLGPVVPALGGPPELWVTDDIVTSVVPAGNTVYIGGAFTKVGRPSGGGVQVSAGTGAPNVAYPRVCGVVTACNGDGQGGWFVGGAFTWVEGQRRVNLARLQAPGRLSTWDPAPNGRVTAIVRRGSVLYVGGDFTEIAGQPRTALAAFDVSSGRLLAWRPEIVRPAGILTAPVNAMAIAGDNVLIGGRFAYVNGQERENLAAVNAGTAALASWRPRTNAAVLSLAVTDDAVFVGGQFDSLNGRAQVAAGAVDREAGNSLPWDPQLLPAGGEVVRVGAMAVSGDTVFLGGSFATVSGEGRAGLAAVTRSGALLSWDPALGESRPSEAYPTPAVTSLALGNGVLYVGGSFTAVEGSERYHGAAFGLPTLSLTPWNPRTNRTVDVIGVSSTLVFIGGEFSSVYDWVWRHDVAALDAVTGRVTAWTADLNRRGVVSSMAAGDGKLYIGGLFDSVGNVPRANLAAIDIQTGTVIPAWDAQVSNAVFTMALRDAKLYIGGGFSAVGGVERDFVAALDAATGQVTNWNPGSNGEVTSLAVGDSLVYLSGWFSMLAGAPRLLLGAVTSADGSPAAWNPQPNGPVAAMIAVGASVYVGGSFSSIGGQPRTCLAALDALTGNATAWRADVDGSIRDLALGSGQVFVAGEFTHVAGVDRPYVAALDTASSAVRPWGPGVDWPVRKIVPGDDAVYLAGDFGQIDGYPTRSLAALSLPTDSVLAPPDRRALTLAPSIPNPAGSAATIRFRLASAGAASLAVYDVQGRLQIGLMDKVSLAAGPHEVQLQVQSWPEGCYFYRLSVGSQSVTKKLVVVK